MSIAVISGDGIGKEVVPVGMACVDAALARHGQKIQWVDFEWGSDHYLRTGRMMPIDGIEKLAPHDAIFLGAVGLPEIPDAETLWGLLIPIRREFEQYVNLRPVRALPGVPSPVRAGADIDVLIVRENNEGEYSDVGGRVYRSLPQESALQVNVFTRHGVERIARYAAQQARLRRSHLTSATKSNGIIHSMPFWDDIVAAVAAETGGLDFHSTLIDALAARLILTPSHFDVIVASNLFGDILSDIAGAIAGSIGVTPSGNINPERRHPSLFEPVHGSAPDIAGQGIANPIGQIWTGVMMLDHLGHREAAADLFEAMTTVTARGISTPDIGGTATTAQVGKALIAELRRTTLDRDDDVADMHLDMDGSGPWP